MDEYLEALVRDVDPPLAPGFKGKVNGQVVDADGLLSLLRQFRATHPEATVRCLGKLETNAIAFTWRVESTAGVVEGATRIELAGGRIHRLVERY